MDSNEQKQIVRPSSIVELSNALRDVSKNSGIVVLQIKYNATPGNVKIHEAFLKYAADETNNEYLMAIGKLLTMAELGKRVDSLQQRLEALEVLVLDHLKVAEELSKEDEEANSSRFKGTF